MILANMDEGKYREHPAWSQSDIKVVLNQSPYHALQSKKERKSPTREQQIGIHFHMLVLEPHRFYKTYEVSAGVDLRTTKGKAWKQEVEEAGKLVISEDDNDRIHKMRDSIMHILDGFSYPAEPSFELSVFSDMHGVPCKARLDVFEKEIKGLWDFKSCFDASPKEARNSILKWGYNIQAAFYLDIARAEGLGGEFVNFIFVEKEPPYAAAVYTLSDNQMEWGRKKYKEGLSIIKHCMDTDDWYSYPESVQVID